MRFIKRVAKKVRVNRSTMLSLGIVAMSLVVAGGVFLAHPKHTSVASLQPEAVGMGQGVAACYSSSGTGCSGAYVTYGSSWDYSGYQTDIPNCGSTVNGGSYDTSLYFGIQDQNGNWVYGPQNMTTQSYNCASSVSAQFLANNYAQYKAILWGDTTGTWYHQETFSGATLSWGGVLGATTYYPRISVPNGNCPSGWTLYSDGHTCYIDSYNGTSVYVNNIQPNTNYNIWVHAGDPLNPDNPTSNSFSCSVSGSLSTSGCTIAAGQTTCAFPLAWTSSNTPNGVRVTLTPQGGTEFNMYNDGSPSNYTVPSGSQPYWGAGTHTVKLYDSKTGGLIDSKSITIVSATSANNPSGTLSATGCTISAGSSSCGIPLQWTLNNSLYGLVNGSGGSYGSAAKNLYTSWSDPAYLATPSGNGVQNVSFGSYLFQLWGYTDATNWVKTGDANASAVCAGGSAWNGSICQAGATNSLPTGYFDSASCTTLSGWSYDPDNSSATDNVAIYTDYGTGAQTYQGNYAANYPRSDVNNAMGVTGDHGFQVPTPSSIKDNTSHSISVFGVDNQTGALKQLSLSPKTLTCAPDTTTPVSCTTQSQCPSGDLCYSGTCTASCPSGYVASGGTCCPTGYTFSGGACVPVCGTSCTGGMQCSAPNTCSCPSGTVQVGGSCVAPPSISTFIVSPTRVRSGSPTKITWSSAGADSCTVTGQNGFSANATSGTNVSSGPITSETDFTLTCTNIAGSVNETQTVFLLPTIIYQ